MQFSDKLTEIDETEESEEERAQLIAMRSAAASIISSGETSRARSFATASVVTGPEGGFTEAEAKMARVCGMTLCSMGERILRCETAPVIAVSAIMYATGNL